MAASDLNHPGRARTGLAVRFLTRLRRFLHDTRAGATAIVTVGVSLMTVGASALIVDHNWLLDQRDVLKHASDAAAVASTIELGRHRGSLPEDEMAEMLNGIAHTFALLNLTYLTGDRLARAEESLIVQTSAHETENKVDVAISADLGGTLFSRHLPMTGNYTGPEAVVAGSGVEVLIAPVEAVLAIDVSTSMQYNLQGQYPFHEPSRMEIVKAAARDLVDVLNPNPEDRVAVSVLPWQGMVRLTNRTRLHWESRGWAQFPVSRHYPAIYVCEPLESCTYTAEDQAMPAQQPERWKACMDETRVSMIGHASHVDEPEWFNPPDQLPFARSIYSGIRGATYDCTTSPYPSDFDYQYCYQRHSLNPQLFCDTDVPRFIPLTTDHVLLNATIDKLEPVGDSTYSTLGLLWGQRLLSHSWQHIWGDPVHPLDPDIVANRGTRKVIVLLTDGQDSHCGRTDPSCETNDVGIARTRACEAVKAEGTEIFVVAAIDDPATSLADALLDCSSQSDRPDGTYAFLDHTREESLRAAFTEIANQLRIVRRIH